VFDRWFSNDGLAFISDEQALGLRSVELQEGDLLLNITGDGITFARSCIVPKEVLPACVNQHVSIIRVNRELADPGYVLSFLTHIDVKPYIESFNAGGSRRAITKGHIESFRLPIPPLETQKAIAHILGTLDDKIELNRQMNATLESMAQALFKSWFVDFDPVIDNALAAGNPIPEPFQARAKSRKAQGDKRRPLPKAIQQQFPSSFVFTEEMGWIPEGWEVSTVGDQIASSGGGTPSTQELSYWKDGTHAFCTPKDMSNLDSFILLDTERHLTNAGMNKISSGQLPAGAVLMSSRAPIGYLAISAVPVSVNQGVIALLPNDRYGAFYILCWTRFNMGQVTDRANGSTFMEISKKNFRQIPFLVPAPRLLECFNGQALAVYSKALLVSYCVRDLVRLRDTILPKLLSGQLRIPDAEKLMADAL
jgi:type I restriction enzyme S subunit